MKTQTIRLMDVFAIGPVMIYSGIKAKSLSDITKFFLIAFGSATIVFNYRNYKKIEGTNPIVYF